MDENLYNRNIVLLDSIIKSPRHKYLLDIIVKDIVEFINNKTPL
jgi:hypothetical protein